MDNHSKSNQISVFIIACVIMALIGSSVDIIVPSLPLITDHFHTSETAARMSVPTYLLAYGLCYSIAHLLSRRFGQRHTLTIALIGYVICSIMIPPASTISTLLILRALQGLFAAGMSATTISLINDAYQNQQRKKYTIYLGIAWATGLVFSPLLGGFLQYFTSWKVPFYFLAVYSFVIMISVILRLPENTKNQQTFHFSTFSKNYQKIFHTHQLIKSAILCGLLYGVITLYNVTGPFLIESVMHYNALIYGSIALCLGAAWVSGNNCARWLMKHREPKTLYGIMIAYALAAIALLILAILSVFSLMATFIPPIILFFTAGALFNDFFNNTTNDTHFAQSAILSIFAGIVAIIGSFLGTNSLLPLAITYLLLLLAIFLVYRYAFVTGKNLA